MFKSSDPRCDQLYASWLQRVRPECTALAMNHNNTPHPPGAVIDAAGIRAEIASYEEGIAILKTMIGIRGSLISPFRIYPLPAEVLERVFEWCGMQGPSSLTVITHICSLWRKIAIKNPALWTHIDIGSNLKDLERATTWIERSRSFPLDVVITPRPEPPPWSLIPALSSWFRQHASRVECLSITDHPSVFPTLPPLPLLKSFKFLDAVGRSSWKNFTYLTGHSPNLLALSISTSITGPSPMWQAINITHLSVGNLEQGIPMQEFSVRQLLATCPYLQSLECHKLSDISTDYSDLLPEEDIPPIPLLSLMELSVGEGTGFRIIDSLNAPQLHKLRLFGRSWANVPSSKTVIFTEYKAFWLSLQTLYQRCRPPLTTLVFDHVSEYLAPVFGHALEKICGPILKELVFEGAFIDIGYLCPAELPEDGGLPFPYLEHLSFSCCRHLDTKTLSRIITQRRHSQQPIKYLHVEDCAQVYGANVSAMQQLIGTARTEHHQNKERRDVLIHEVTLYVCDPQR